MKNRYKYSAVVFVSLMMFGAIAAFQGNRYIESGTVGYTFNTENIFFNNAVFEPQNNFIYLDFDFYPEDSEYIYLYPVANFGGPVDSQQYAFAVFEPGHVVYAINNPAEVNNKQLSSIDLFAQNKLGDRYKIMTLDSRSLIQLSDMYHNSNPNIVERGNI